MFKRKKIQRIIVGIISVLMIGIISLQSEKIYSFSNGSYGLELTPAEFHMENMRPGYMEDHTLTVKNTGDLIIKYTVKIAFKSGEKLFKELNVTVKHESTELYKGKLSELTILPRILPANTDDPLNFSIGLPGEAGNEFQGLTTSFEIQVQGEGEDPPTDGEDPGEDPGEDDGNNPPDSNTPPQDGNGTSTNPPSKDTGSLPQTGEENPILLILSGVFMSLAGLGLLLIKKSILPNPFRRG
ncbi:LPXTG cell wall anchor domain-containing protein [Fictibacillus halophilus]|uniref:LPXTG cell wall anchor domain-containing protein n=1 Tax=Fictibacillus halophilus TaxID=1610490 RepID=UPI001CFA2787|nr:LPXTG cell wall anchor domain-containing protein [Fictibacillus halophilus]